ncbi:2-C-methyl-D-erythritol 2,4-cyclodiphosphate synthase, partial [Priestia megaterium]|uniref:2-C-methyl-D-erythritol 2,4-cyclodiphosphate synthase n=1 Tax=Priestia megaterium TaxID=1404 RepID=UPI0012B89661
TIAHPLLPPATKPHIPNHFPDTHPQFKHPHSPNLLQHLSKLLKHQAYQLTNVDSTIIPQKPKIPPYIQPITEPIPQLLQASISQIN